MVQIKRMADYERDVRDEAAEVFVDGYYKELSFFSKDRNKLKAAFRDLFCPDVFLCCGNTGGDRRHTGLSE
ncbi:hypothetical protein [Paenibacillus sp. DMB20]|uniref:hypothetical protein n=1 Tax=Paenibacillus sp. DMB20 TaxID=1642570 RepID=UPI000B10BF09